MTRLASMLLLCAGCVTTDVQHTLKSALPETLVQAAVLKTPQKTAVISWTFPQPLETPDLIFKLYHTLDLGAPLAQWPLCLTVPGSERTASVPAVQPQEFFVLTASNYLGESGYATQ